MTPPSPPDDVTSNEDFEAYLSELLQAAVENGIDPRGAWEYRASDGHFDLEVEVVELESSAGD